MYVCLAFRLRMRRSEDFGFRFWGLRYSIVEHLDSRVDSETATPACSNHGHHRLNIRSISIKSVLKTAPPLNLNS